MKRHLAIALGLLLALGATAQKSTVTCTFDGLPAGTRLLLNEPHGGRLVPTDTLVPDAKGRVKLERYSTQPEFLVLSLDQKQPPMLHLITLPKERITLEATYMPALNHIDITSAKGSDNMGLYRRFSNLTTRSFLNQDPNRVSDSLEVLLSGTPGTLMSAFLVTFYEQYFEQYAPLYKKIRDALVGQYADNDFVRHIDSRLRSALIAGMEAPDIALPNPQGDTLRLSALRGKVVLIDFWASWCGPCRRENPHVVRLYERFRDKGFEVFSVSLDQSHDKWVDAIAKDNLSWPYHVSDLRGWNSAAGRLYGIQSIPATVLVDREGNIVARNLRGSDLDKKLNELLAQ